MYSKKLIAILVLIGLIVLSALIVFDEDHQLSEELLIDIEQSDSIAGQEFVKAMQLDLELAKNVSISMIAISDLAHHVRDEIFSRDRFDTYGIFDEGSTSHVGEILDTIVDDTHNGISRDPMACNFSSSGMVEACREWAVSPELALLPARRALQRDSTHIVECADALGSVHRQIVRFETHHNQLRNSPFRRPHSHSGSKMPTSNSHKHNEEAVDSFREYGKLIDELERAMSSLRMNFVKQDIKWRVDRARNTHIKMAKALEEIATADEKWLTACLRRLCKVFFG